MRTAVLSLVMVLLGTAGAQQPQELMSQDAKDTDKDDKKKDHSDERPESGFIDTSAGVVCAYSILLS